MQEALKANNKVASRSQKEPQVDYKAMQTLFEDCFAIPKIELHAHIGGCLRPETFLQLALDSRIDVDHIDFYNVNIKSAFEIFKIVGQVLTDLDTLYRIIREIIEDYAKQNCIYLELRSTPKPLNIKKGTTEKGGMQDYINTVL